MKNSTEEIVRAYVIAELNKNGINLYKETLDDLMFDVIEAIDNVIYNCVNEMEQDEDGCIEAFKYSRGF